MEKLTDITPAMKQAIDKIFWRKDIDNVSLLRRWICSIFGHKPKNIVVRSTSYKTTIYDAVCKRCYKPIDLCEFDDWVPGIIESEWRVNELKLDEIYDNCW